MTKPQQFSPEVRERAVRLLREHQGEDETQWAAIRSIAETIGCSAETPRTWVQRAERDAAQRPGLTTDEPARLTALERACGAYLPHGVVRRLPRLRCALFSR